MAKQIWAANALTGGGAGALDDINHTSLENGNIAIVIAPGSVKAYFYHYDSTDDTAESSPDVIIPDSNSSGTGAWNLVGVVCATGEFSGNVSQDSDLTFTIGSGEGSVKLEHNSTGHYFAITPYDGGGFDTDKQIIFDADAGDWEIEGDVTITTMNSITTDNMVSSNTTLRTKVVEIGNWDMNVTASVTIAHGLTYADIISVRVMVQNDAGTAKYMGYDDTNGNLNITSTDATNVNISRGGGSLFDSTNFNAVMNRGWILIDYLG